MTVMKKLQKAKSKSVHQACTVQNNKGMTLVELIITFSILLVIVIGMFNLILDLNLNLDDQKIIKDYTEYSNFINNDLEQDLVTHKPIAIAIIKSSFESKECKYSSDYYYVKECQIGSDNIFKIALSPDPIESDSELEEEVNEENLPIQAEQPLEDLCSDYFPCAVYAYYEEEEVKFGAFALHTPNNLASDDEYGIYRLDSEKDKKHFEELPNKAYVSKKKIVKSDMFFNDESFVMNFNLYLTGDSKNYGFKIAYPLSKIS